MYSLIWVGCGSGDGDMSDPIMNSGGNTDGNSGGSTVMELQGGFVGDAHPTSGTATVSKDRNTLTLTNFKTDAGPKLLLYLSTDVDSNDFVNLGELKGLEGDFEYNIPQDTDLNTHKYVVVWCVDFFVSFGHAELK